MLITMIMASFPIGKMVDKIGVKLPLTIGSFVLASALLLFINGNLFTIMFSMCSLGSFTLFVMSSAMSLSAALVKPENRGKVRGCLNFTGLGMLLGNFLYDLVPQLPFLLTMGLAIPMLIIILFHIYEPKRQQAAICVLALGFPEGFIL